jgi:tetratricopeptide (TPR) repeat protein
MHQFQLWQVEQSRARSLDPRALTSQKRNYSIIHRLQRLSLVTQLTRNGTSILWVHDLVHHMLQIKLMNRQERKTWFQHTINIICKALEETGDPELPENWNEYDKFVAQVQALQTHAEKQEVYNLGLLDTSSLIAAYLLYSGCYNEALKWDENTFLKRKDLLGEEHPNTLTSMNNLASTYQYQDKYDKAEALQAQALKMRKKVLGEEHLDTLTA